MKHNQQHRVGKAGGKQETALTEKQKLLGQK
jgi:hypothetical protein